MEGKLDLKLKESLYCPHCRGDLRDAAGGLECVKCRRHYPISGKAALFVPLKNSLAPSPASADSLLLGVKNFFKKSPELFKFLYRLTTPLVGKKPAEIMDDLPSGALVINLGSGVMPADPRILDVDYIAYPNVSIAADATSLPFKDSSLDGVVSESLLEHAADAQKVMAEIRRVLKPGGLVYIQTPFMLGFHSSPNDYCRWTIPGLEKLCDGFKKEEAGVAVGPTSALTALFSEWFSMIFSFGSQFIYQCWNLIFLVLWIPVNWLDIALSHLPFSSNIARAVYFIGRKI